MEFQQMLLKVDQALNSEDVQALVFLCADLLDKDVSCISTARDLFTHLQLLGHLSSQQPCLLAELLQLCRRSGLLGQLGLPHHSSAGLVSPYRKLLFSLAENITADDLKSIKFLLYNTLPRGKLEENITMLSLFLEMEKMDHLSNTNLETLEQVIGTICPSLKRRIIKYKEENESVTQRTGVSYMSARQPELEECPVCPGDQAYTSHYNRGPTVGSIPGDEIWNQWRQNKKNPGHSCLPQDSCSLSSGQYSAVSLETVDAKVEGQSLHLSQPTSSRATDTTFSSEESHQVHFTNSCEEKNLSAADHIQGKKKELEAYEMRDDRRRGFCLIINNNDFSSSQIQLKNREGTEVDEKSLVDVFEWLGFETQTERDCSQQRMRLLLDRLSREDHTCMDCLVCCVLSHGERGLVYGVDGRGLPFRDLTRPFSGGCCATLREKPKLFFIQTCQGRMEQLAVPVESNVPDPGSAQSNLTTDAAVPLDSIPEEADFLLGMATVPDHVSFRDKKEGTWFIQSLCENLLLLVPGGHDLLSILTRVNLDVSSKTDKDGTKKQMPQPAFSLRKRVVFPVPKRPPPKLKVQASTWTRRTT